MKRLITILTSIMVLSLSSSFAQYVTKGVVVDNNNVPVIGAAVLQVGTSNGTATGLNGEFILTVPSASTVLVISFLGYETVKIPADQATKIVLKDDTQFLEEVLVIGYGQVKKSDATGSV
ncbi:MAG: carboxypeptidase-like regulatory domain-containing protein, partial [Bacteroidales bacterium]